ncbi:MULTISPECIES: polysaccharide biosynthesis/export family protein [unclassified Dysgonomonas]|jgi:polysaccharide export outer membrane protein|uniref:polysaccharide biosynthesis/export family protein n=1 Tax=unclassified Dysgonomonas TaxID=2630389 RepID=UPI0025C07366|nr:MULTISPECIES: polysaccharide biosynthesis/export family protein [unclassified Dysgonomonas]MDR2002602.1 polysaccharide export protein [Prevotella sp.]HMM01883.1 polysaccharide biosynthesis/export family protein [Dysgonomonas sp.]
MRSLLLFLSICILFFSSCNSSKNITYFQDIPLGQNISTVKSSDIEVMPKDLISIVVSSKNPELATLFNLPKVSYQAGSTTSNENAGTQILGYTVDSGGNIDFPVLGTIHVAGFNRKQLSSMIKERLLNENLVNDPVVTVDFLNLKISVLGEVKNPGKYSIDRDQITLLEAISMAGDLTIYGKRNGVFVIREKDGNRITYKMDLRSSETFSSPAYYLRQNDVIYIEPNSTRSGQSTINDNNVKSVSLWMSIASFVTTLAVLIFK